MLFLELFFVTCGISSPSQSFGIPAPTCVKHGATIKKKNKRILTIVHGLKDEGLTSLSVTCLSQCPCFWGLRAICSFWSWAQWTYHSIASVAFKIIKLMYHVETVQCPSELTLHQGPLLLLTECRTEMATSQKMDVFTASVIQNKDTMVVGGYLYHLWVKLSFLHNSSLSRRTLWANGHSAYQMRNSVGDRPMSVSPETKQGYKSVYNRCLE